MNACLSAFESSNGACCGIRDGRTEGDLHAARQAEHGGGLGEDRF